MRCWLWLSVVAGIARGLRVARPGHVRLAGVTLCRKDHQGLPFVHSHHILAFSDQDVLVVQVAPAFSVLGDRTYRVHPFSGSSSVVVATVVVVVTAVVVAEAWLLLLLYWLKLWHTSVSYRFMTWFLVLIELLVKHSYLACMMDHPALENW